MPSSHAPLTSSAHVSLRQPLRATSATGICTRPSMLSWKRDCSSSSTAAHSRCCRAKHACHTAANLILKRPPPKAPWCSLACLYSPLMQAMHPISPGYQPSPNLNTQRCWVHHPYTCIPSLVPQPPLFPHTKQTLNGLLPRKHSRPCPSPRKPRSPLPPSP